jgi:serine/threonine protein kinase
LDVETKDMVSVFNIGAYTYKRYRYLHFQTGDEFVMQFQNEYQIMKKARDSSSKFVIHLDAVFLGRDHVCLRMKQYENVLNKFLEVERDARMLKKIMWSVGHGLQELHNLGYVHRDIKPDNIVFNIYPYEVKIIDFNTSFRTSQMSKGTFRGTYGFTPNRELWRDGSTSWDIYSLACVLLCSDMEIKEYYKTNSEREIFAVAQ